ARGSSSRNPGSARIFAGTVPYMSPEQVRSEDVDHRTDLYSLGVVLYEAATGHRPFDGTTPEATSEAILNSVPRPPMELVGTLPAALDRVIGRALAKNRDDRYQSAAELGADLLEASPPASDHGPAAAASASKTATAGFHPRVVVPVLALV